MAVPGLSVQISLLDAKQIVDRMQRFVIALFPPY
jgi:hypothetical protein